MPVTVTAMLTSDIAFPSRIASSSMLITSMSTSSIPSWCSRSLPGALQAGLLD